MQSSFLHILLTSFITFQTQIDLKFTRVWSPHTHTLYKNLQNSLFIWPDVLYHIESNEWFTLERIGSLKWLVLVMPSSLLRTTSAGLIYTRASDQCRRTKERRNRQDETRSAVDFRPTCFRRSSLLILCFSSKCFCTQGFKARSLLKSAQKIFFSISSQQSFRFWTNEDEFQNF